MGERNPGDGGSERTRDGDGSERGERGAVGRTRAHERTSALSRVGEAVGETLGRVSLRRRWVGGNRPWRVSASAFPSAGTLEERARFLIRFAVLAPSSHNTQPWLFTVDEGEVRLFADLDRWLSVADHDKRELYLSLGAALENLLVAAEHFGLGHEVTYLPGSDGTHAATVRLSESPSADSDSGKQSAEVRSEHGEVPNEHDEVPSGYRGSRLFTAIPHRRTSRGRFRDKSIPTADLRALERHCVEDDVSLQLVADPETLESIADLTARANRRLYADYAYRRELGRWVGRGAFGDLWPVAKVGKVAVTYLNLGRQRARKDGRAIREAPVVAFLRTDGDDRRSRIRAGQAYERLSLLATALGVGNHPVSALLEVENLRRELTDLLGRSDRPVQHFFRLGYPERAGDSRLSPRRPAEAVVVD
ncbi:nitroreductase family protein (plasmid) [Halorussus limi]|uniref:Nitroreductase family protein n=1 Tax=Halorussus limi TaxID=2938695 RepID=A0A8U0HZ24_9EURY|nr:nitroreductase family protein [Halorussus limi]UPV76385.1 nitroreductase family protein [Halorussus limi]